MNIDMIDQIETVAKGLYQVVDRVVVVGGAARQFYVQNDIEHDRPTVDVDCVVNAMTYLEFAKFEGELRKVGFSNCTDPAAPICRWIYKGRQVDIMPVDDTALGFSNPWYAEGFDNAIKVQLPSCSIDIFPYPYYLASKFEAFLGRPDDFRMSSDMEDIMVSLNARKDLEADCREMPNHMRAFFQKHLSKFIRDNQFLESIRSHTGATQEGSARILNFFKRLEGYRPQRLDEEKA